ncbi:MAG: hypothetical protein AAF416_04060 [Pseudomonadota bacterium]
MAIFAGLSETVGAAVLPLVQPDVQSRLVWFVMGFPTALMLMFFGTLWIDAKLLYGARDLDTDEARLKLLGVTDAAEGKADPDDHTRRLESFLYDGDYVANAAALQDWMDQNNIAAPIPFFLEAPEHSGARRRAVLALSGNAVEEP